VFTVRNSFHIALTSITKEPKAGVSKEACTAMDIESQPFDEIADDSQKAEKDIHSKFPVVGIGASAGGLAVFETFFSSMPADVDLGMAFVLVQHLAPDHKSILSDLIRSYTRMQVFVVEDGMKVMPNCAYIIPPNRDMAFLNGALHLLEPSVPRGQRLPIDYFFRSLAQDQHERAICIVLSGAGSDGTLGVRAIKGEGGMVIVQNPDSAEYDAMPRSAIATGMVDYVLSVAEMPGQLLNYVNHAFAKPHRAESVPMPENDNALKKIYVLLRAQTGNDFSQYKPSTIYRRIERRMALHQIEKMDDYVRYLQQSPTEVEELFHDLLIGVTSFYRDQDSFKVLEQQIIPKLFKDKLSGATIRVWSPCCSTGEEAYSIAILLQEHMEAQRANHTIQLFATDIDSRAIATARTGVYPASIASDVPQERLSRYFTAGPDGSTYRIHKNIRDMLIFSEQNVVKDPPFSKLDLISCRNFLIYLDKDMQKKLIALFHYALNPGGVLFLGSSESVCDHDSLFTALDRKSRLFQKKEDRYTQRITGDGFFSLAAPVVPVAPSFVGKTAPLAKLSLREITERAFLQHEDLAGALVNRQGDILYLHGRTGLYLEPTPGEVDINNILKMAREGLMCELTTALYKAAEKNEVVYCPGLHVKTNGHFTTVNLSIRPVNENHAGTYQAPLYLVVLEKVPQPDPAAGDLDPEGSEAQLDGNAHIETLRQQLRAKEEYLQAANEELETANEELKSSNEEMQSINEEMQSTNEELETSREELQSINEELATVNTELQTKVTDLYRLNNDMNNMLAGTFIAIVFVDLQLRILRFTPTATDIINLIASDVGRPVAHLVSNLVGYDSLVADVQAVLDTLVHTEREVQTMNGKWYIMRIRPYRTTDNVIEGAVLTFVDITEMKWAKDALSVSETRFRRLFEAAKDGILILDAQTGKIVNANQFLVDLLGYTEEQLMRKAVWEIGFFKDIIANREKFLELQEKEYVRYENLPLETADGRQIEVEFISSVYMVHQKKVIQCDIRTLTKADGQGSHAGNEANTL
jgi:two-component system CheB/CheR fusion protein